MTDWSESTRSAPISLRRETLRERAMDRDSFLRQLDWVLVAAASNDDSAMLDPVARRAQGGLVMSGQPGNGHALEAAYRLSELVKAPVSLVLDAERPAPMARMPQQDVPAEV